MQARQQLESELNRIAAPILEEAGVELVELSIRGTGFGQVLRMDIDRPGASGIGVEDCQRVSRRLGEAVDETDLMDSSYALEVSSPGVERPIRTADDIRRNTGRRITVTCAKADGGERSVQGLLRGQENHDLLLETGEGERVRVPLAEVRYARQDVGF